MTTDSIDGGEAPGATRVAVYGLGKMGLPLAAVLADAGFAVEGVDVDADVVRSINDGTAPVDEPGLDDLLATHVGDRLRATTDGVGAADRAEVTVVLVPTVLDEAKRADLSPVLAAAEAIGQGIDAGDLVVLESTVPPGTTGGVFAETVETAAGLDAGDDFGVAHCPERTSSGRVLRDLTESYPKIVGGVDPESTAAAAALYRRFNEPGVIEMDSATAAEAVKVFEGVYRDTNIALANELARACEEWGLDSSTVFDAANSQPYCDIHVPGVGVGGHCIPVYPHFVIQRASETPLLETSRAVNDGMPAHTVDVLEALLDEQGVGVDGARVLVLGLTYRPGVDETRYAPALVVIDELLDRGAAPFAHDPLLDDDEIAASGATATEDPLSVDSLDGVILATGHDAYRTLDLDHLADGMRTRTFVDGRRFFSPADLERFAFAVVGRGGDGHPFTHERN